MRRRMRNRETEKALELARRIMILQTKAPKGISFHFEYSGSIDGMNMRGLIHGSDPKRIGCEKEGVLKIGRTEVKIRDGEEAILPNLFNGCSGKYEATFTDTTGNVYSLEAVVIKSGWILPPAPLAAELMELRCRVDTAEEKLERLEKIFDTNSLNFLIK